MINRRSFLQGSLLGFGLVNTPAIIASPRKPTLRVLGTHVTLQEQIRQKAEQDLGFHIEFTPGGSAQVLQQASDRPDTFDVYEQWSNSVKVLWRSQSIQALDSRRIRNWNEINNLAKQGRITENAKLGAGDRPSKLLYVNSDNDLGSVEGNRISFLPYVHNADSYAIDAAHIQPLASYQGESWGRLLDSDFHGKVGIVNDPTIGLFDLILAVQAQKLMTFKDIGDLTYAELDKLFEILVEYKRSGHFRGFWSSVPQSVEWMKSGQTHIQSMFSPGVAALNGSGINAVYAAPKEGYRAWHGVMCLSSQVDSERKDMAYEFMNWWLSGWAGGFISRQGYYISNPERAHQHMSDAEWAYWYQGQPAETDLLGTDGHIVARPGDIRTGGSYEQRFENIAVWNTVMSTFEYSLTKWNELLLARSL